MSATVQLLEVELFVCPTCLAVGKVPAGRGSNPLRGYCTGGAADSHKKAKMTLRRFREVRE